VQTKAAKSVLGEYYREPERSAPIPFHLIKYLLKSMREDHFVSDTGDIVYYQTDPHLHRDWLQILVHLLFSSFSNYSFLQCYILDFNVFWTICIERQEYRVGLNGIILFLIALLINIELSVFISHRAFTWDHSIFLMYSHLSKQFSTSSLSLLMQQSLIYL